MYVGIFSVSPTRICETVKLKQTMSKKKSIVEKQMQITFSSTQF